MKATFLGVMLLACVLVPAAPARAQAAIFKFESDEFWLNLHKFLHVLGSAQNKDPNALREAVAAAPGEAERGLAPLTDAERKIWVDAVTAYAQGLSRKDPIRDLDLAQIEGRLGEIDEAPNVAAAKVDDSLRAVLEGAAPLYRKAWWPAHRTSNRAFVAATQQLLKTQGQTVLQFITRAYQMPWPSDGYPVHAVAYAHWAGAYSTWGNLLVVSTNAGAGTLGWGGLESVFHESMHQWDDAVDKLLTAHATAAGGRVRFNLSHALVFSTAGEAVRHVAPTGYVPYAESAGVWQRGMQALRAPIEEIWLPYLNGRGTRDEALAALVQRTLVPPQRASILTFQTDDFWLNLHHFLYAAGAVEAKLPEASRQALAPAGPDVQRGLARLDPEQRRQWTMVGCSGCHTPSFTTGNSFVAALRNKPVNLYSDLLTHDIGVGLADGVGQGGAGGREFRTAPLWGLGQRIFFLHDGRTTDLIEAIRAHVSSGSEATGSVMMYNVSESLKQDLLNFLRSL
jgi:hypothetical protein